MRRYVLDSYAMIAYFEDEPGADRVAQVLRQLVQGKFLDGFLKPKRKKGIRGKK